LSIYASSAPERRLTSSSFDQGQPDLAALEDISLRSTPVAVGDSSGIAKKASEAAKVAPVVIQIPRLVGTAGILYQCRGAVAGRRAALECRQFNCSIATLCATHVDVVLRRTECALGTANPVWVDRPSAVDFLAQA
jgi:hypothetical protein